MVLLCYKKKQLIIQKTCKNVHRILFFCELKICVTIWSCDPATPPRLSPENLFNKSTNYRASNNPAFSCNKLGTSYRQFGDLKGFYESLKNNKQTMIC